MKLAVYHCLIKLVQLWPKFVSTHLVRPFCFPPNSHYFGTPCSLVFYEPWSHSWPIIDIGPWLICGCLKILEFLCPMNQFCAEQIPIMMLNMVKSFWKTNFRISIDSTNRVTYHSVHCKYLSSNCRESWKIENMNSSK